MYKFHPCYSPRHAPNSPLILRAWLLINLGEKRKVRVGCEAPRPGELVVASMSQASLMVGFEAARCCLVGAKSAVTAATVGKEEAAVLIVRVTHVYFQHLHPEDLMGNLEAKPTEPRTHHLSPPAPQAASSSFSLSMAYIQPPAWASGCNNFCSWKLKKVFLLC